MQLHTPVFSKVAPVVFRHQPYLHQHLRHNPTAPGMSCCWHHVHFQPLWCWAIAAGPFCFNIAHQFPLHDFCHVLPPAHISDTALLTYRVCVGNHHTWGESDCPVSEQTFPNTWGLVLCFRILSPLLFGTQRILALGTSGMCCLTGCSVIILARAKVL